MLSSAQAGHRFPYMQTPDNALVILGFSKRLIFRRAGIERGMTGIM